MKIDGHCMRHVPAGAWTTVILLWLFIHTTQIRDFNVAHTIARLFMATVFSLIVAMIWESVTNGEGEGLIQVINDKNSMVDILWHMVGTAAVVISVMGWMLLRLFT